MKLTKALSFLAALLVFGLGASAYGQNYSRTGDEVFVVNLDHDVTLEDQTLPAGTYEFRRDNSFENPVITIFNEDTQQYEAGLLPNDSEALEIPDNSRVVLEKVGKKYYLSEIWMADRLRGYKIPLPEKAQALKHELNRSTSD